MLHKLNTLREEKEEGFTLIELLVVILIIGILAAIAIPVFLNQRQTANDGAVESDVKNATSQVETWVSAQSGKDATIDLAAVNSMSIKRSTGVTIRIRGSANKYCVFGYHVNGKKHLIAGSNYWVYDSTKGTPSNGSAYCSAPADGTIGADGKTIGIVTVNN